MTSALQWFIVLFSGYAVMMLFWAYMQSRRSLLAAGNPPLSSALSSWKRNNLQIFFLLGSGAFILMPAVVYQYGVWGLVWFALVLAVMALYRLLSKLLSLNAFAVVASIFQHQAMQTVRALVVVVGVIFLLTWQFLIMIDIIGALDAHFDFKLMPALKMALTLGFILLLLISVSLAGERVQYYLSGLKLVVLMVCCGAVALVIYAYIGGAFQFSNHIDQFYKFSDPSLSAMVSKAFYIPKMPHLMLELSSFLALGFSLIVLMVMQDISGEADVAEQHKGRGVKRHGLVKLMAGFVFLAALLIFVVYLILFGFGAHFTGADSDYQKESQLALSILFDPMHSSALFPNLIASFIQSLVSVIPLVIALFTVLVLVIVLSTSQVLLYQAGRLVNINFLIPGLKLIGMYNAEDRISYNVRQRRSYAFILMIVMVLSLL